MAGSARLVGRPATISRAVLRAAKRGTAALAMWGTVAVFMPLPLDVPVASLLFGGSMRILKSRTHLEPKTPSYLSTPRGSATRLLVFGFCLASSAAITYTTAYNADLSIQTSIWVYVVTVPVSFWLLLRGLRAAKYSVPGAAPVPVPRSAM